MLAREVLARAENLSEIQTVVSLGNPASLRMLARLGDLRSDCVNDTCDVVVRVSRSPAATEADAA